MNIVIIGSGNVSASLGRKFVKAGHHILQILSRNSHAASELAYEWDTESANYSSLINKDADVYIIAVSDNAIDEVVKDLRLPGKVVAHTAASVNMNVLKKVTDNYGVFYPLQSLRKEVEAAAIPIYTEASNEKTLKVLNELAHSIYNSPVHSANFDKRAKLHVAAVIVNNFTNHIFTLAEDYCNKEGVEFTELLPLINNTITRLNNEPPSAMQTGPASRQDFDTIAKHEALLKKHPKLLKLYQFLTDSILNKQI